MTHGENCWKSLYIFCIFLMEIISIDKIKDFFVIHHTLLYVIQIKTKKINLHVFDLPSINRLKIYWNQVMWPLSSLILKNLNLSSWFGQIWLCHWVLECTLTVNFFYFYLILAFEVWPTHKYHKNWCILLLILWDTDFLFYML